MLSGTARPSSIAVNLSPYGFYHFAKEFYQASKAITITDGASPVKLYLIGHALELYLKSYLLVKGVQKADLKKKYQHNIEKIWSACKVEGLLSIITIEPGIDAEIKSFNGFYQSKSLEYFTIATVFIQHKTIAVSKIIKLIEELETKIEILALRA